MALLTPNGAIKNIVVQFAGLPVVYYSHIAPPATAGMRSGLEGEGIDTFARHALTGLSAIEWQAPDVGGYVKYRPIEVELLTDGPNGADEWAPDRVFGRYDGGGWTGRLTQTLEADETTIMYVDTELTGSFPQVIYGAQEAIVVDGITDEGGGVWSLSIAARGAGDTPPQTHEIVTGRQPAYFTSHPTFWAQRGASIWHGLIDAEGNLIGDYEERWAGEIDGQIEVTPHGVKMTLKPLTGVIARAPAQREPEVFTLATGVHRFIRGKASKLQIIQETFTTSTATVVRRGVTGEVHEVADDDEITVGWPGATLRRLNTTLEDGRGTVTPDTEADGGHIKVVLRPEKVVLTTDAAMVSYWARIHTAHAPSNFLNGELQAPTDGDDLISAAEQMDWGVDVNHVESDREPDKPGGRWAHTVKHQYALSAPDDFGYSTRPWPLMAYATPKEEGMLLSTAPSSIPADGLELVVFYIDHNGEEQSAPFLASSVTDLGDGTYWLAVNPARPFPRFGQRTEDDAPKIVRATYVRNLEFWRFILQAMASGTGLEALGEYDVHTNGSGLPGFRLNDESFKRIRLPAALSDVSGAALRDPEKTVIALLKMAMTCVGIETGPDGRAWLTAYRREAARPDLSRLSLGASVLAPPGAAASILTRLLPQGANTISAKIGLPEGQTETVEIRHNHGINAANRGTFHLGAYVTGETFDLDLSKVVIGPTLGDVAAALIPVGNRIFTLTAEGRRQFTVGVDGNRINVGNLRPYDVLSITSPHIQASDGTWGVTDHSVRLVAASEPQLDGFALLVLEDATVTAVGWNACGLITARTATTITIDEDEYVDSYSLVDGSPQKGIDQFSEGDNVKVAAWGDWSNAVDTTITDITGNVMTLADAPPAMSSPDWGIVWPADYADMSTAHRQLLVMGDADGEVTTGVDAGVIT